MLKRLHISTELLDAGVADFFPGHSPRETSLSSKIYVPEGSGTLRLGEEGEVMELSVEELSRLGQQALSAQPFSTLTGASLASFSEVEAVIEVPAREELLQQDGYVHGGVIGYLTDNALTFAGGSVLGPRVLTQEYEINYLRPVGGEKLSARAPRAVLREG